MSNKTIDTLIDDIYGLFGGHHAVSPEAIQEWAQELAGIITARLTEGAERRVPSLRMSNLGKCANKLYYDLNSEDEAEDVTPQNRLKFLYGDLLESLLLFLAKEAGHRIERQQEEVEVDGVVGHIDAVIDGVVVDVKSASSRSFERFKNGSIVEDDPFGYMEQLAGYSKALGLPGAFLAINKETAALALPRFDADYLEVYDISGRIQHLREVTNADAPPAERPYHAEPDGKSGNMKIPRSPCGYCNRKHECWSDANDGFGLRTFLYSHGPVHLTEVVNTPKVMEV